MNTHKKTAAILVGLALLSSPLYADYALDTLKKAHKGDVVAMRKIGYMKFTGDRTKMDRKNGLAWLKKAAENDDAQAMYYLGCIYEQGIYVKQNKEEAEAYLEKAASKGHKKATKKLAEMKDSGEGKKDESADDKKSENKKKPSKIVENEKKTTPEPPVDRRSDSKAEKEFAVDNTQEKFVSYVKDAKAGKISYDECVVIAKKYREIEEHAKSFSFNMIAAAGGNEEAQEELNLRFGGSSLWPWAQKDAESIRITNIQYSAEAQRWFRLATEKFDAEAQYKMGLYWEYIIGGALSIIKTVAWWEVAATQGNAEAQFSLGRHFYETAQHNADRREEFLGKATKYLKMASDQGYKRAAELLAELKPTEKSHEKVSSPVAQEVSDKAKKDFQKGFTHYCTENSLEEAVEFFTSSAQEGYADAQFYLGLCYMGGKGVEQDLSTSFIWFLRAAEQGHARAQYSLGLFYEKNIGVSQNNTEAVKWYRKSAEQNDADAQFELALCYMSGTGVPKNVTEGIQWLRKAAANGNSDASALLKKLEG